jgi:hypothetical protein
VIPTKTVLKGTCAIRETDMAKSLNALDVETTPGIIASCPIFRLKTGKEVWANARVIATPTKTVPRA